MASLTLPSSFRITFTNAPCVIRLLFNLALTFKFLVDIFIFFSLLLLLLFMYVCMYYLHLGKREVDWWSGTSRGISGVFPGCVFIFLF